MSKPFSVLLKSAFTILFACSAIPRLLSMAAVGMAAEVAAFMAGVEEVSTAEAVADSSGGGGARGGSYAPPAAGYGGSRGAAAPYASRPGGGYAAQPGNIIILGPAAILPAVINGMEIPLRRPLLAPADNGIRLAAHREPRTFGCAIGSRAFHECGRLPRL